MTNEKNDTKEAVAEETLPPAPALTHPDLMPKAVPSAIGKKQRRTIVRTAKLVNPGGGDQAPSLVQVPIEPSHNNHGNMDDPSSPLRHYLNKGFMFPAEFDPEKYNFLYCAVSDCWDKAQYPATERCTEHQRMWDLGWIRYATRNKAPRT